MFFADSVMIDVAHHIDDFAGHFFRSGCITTMFVFLRDSQWRERQCCNEDRSHRNFQSGRFIICGIKHGANLVCTALWSIVAASLCEARR